MAQEREPPDAVLASTELTGGLTDIDDDPDSPDGNWMVATGNNVNVDCRVSFATPDDPLVDGADLQFDTGQSGDPDGRLELWEAGSLVRAGSDVPITGSGQMLTLTWNAAEISAAADVECKFVGTKAGGSPSARNAVDLGAIEWDAEVSAVSEITGSTTLTATPSGQLKGTGVLDGTALATVTPTGDLKGNTTMAGTGLAKGTGVLGGTALATVTPTGDVKGTGVLAGIATGTITPTGALKGTGVLTGNALATVTPTGLAKGTGVLGGTALATVTPTALLKGTGVLAGLGTLTITPTGTVLDLAGVPDGLPIATAATDLALAAQQSTDDLVTAEQLTKDLPTATQLVGVTE